MHVAIMVGHPCSPDHKNEVKMLGTVQGVGHVSRVASGVLQQETDQKWAKYVQGNKQNIPYHPWEEYEWNTRQHSLDACGESKC
jgi:hypothetical protein